MTYLDYLRGKWENLLGDIPPLATGGFIPWEDVPKVFTPLPDPTVGVVPLNSIKIHFTSLDDDVGWERFRKRLLKAMKEVDEQIRKRRVYL